MTNVKKAVSVENSVDLLRSERRTSERALPESDKKYKSYINQSPEGVFILDNLGNCIEINPAGCSLLGYCEEELLKMSVRDISESEGKTYFKRLFETGVHNGEITLIKKDGTKIIVDLQAVALGPDRYIGFARDVTQKKLAEAALRNSEERYRMIFENSPMGIVHFDQNGATTTVNNRFTEILGSNKEAYIGFNPLKSLRDQNMKESIQQAVDGSVSVYEGIYHSIVGNKVIPIRVIHCPAVSDKGEFLGGIGIYEDLSEQWDVKAALRKSEERYRSIFNNSPVGIGYYDDGGTITHCNNRFAEIMGAPIDKIIGFNGLSKIKDTAMRNALEKSLQGEVGSYEGNYLSITGNKVTPLRATFSCIKSDSGDIIGGIGIFEDITEQMKAEEALRKSEQYNDLIINGVSDILALYEVTEDTIFKFVKVNSSFLSFINRTEEDIIGKLIQDVLPPDLAKVWIDKNRKVITGGQPCKFIDDAANGCFEVNLIPVFESDKCTHLILSARDITDRKKVQEHQLTIDKLNSIGLLAGGIAHDFNNILTIIAGNITLSKIKLNGLTGESKLHVANYLDEADKASHRAKHLTQQLLTFAKGGEPITETVSIPELIYETAGFVLSGSNVKCEYLLPDDLWPAEVDPGLISQVIQNLIINSNQAMPEGGIILVSGQNVVVNESTHLPLKEGLYIKLTIKDTGIGISPEFLNKIFDPYFTTKQKGNGLGLSIVHSIISKHNGHITVESQLGRGTDLHIYLPASRGKIAEKQIAAGLKLSKGKVLLMDDEEAIRDVISEMLRETGYEVACTSEGNETIGLYSEAKCSGMPFDAVIMDLTIPGGMGGKEAIKKLLEVDPEVKAIVSSGYANDPVMSNYRDFGFKAVVAKPFTIEELGEKLSNVIKEEITESQE